MTATFASLVDEIEAAYSRLEHTLGWRFLYTSDRTFSPETQIALVPLNPGGKVREPPKPSVEAGNAFWSERWDNGRHNTLQLQITRLFRSWPNGSTTNRGRD